MLTLGQPESQSGGLSKKQMKRLVIVLNVFGETGFMLHFQTIFLVFVTVSWNNFVLLHFILFLLAE